MTIHNSFNIWIFSWATGPGSPSPSRSSVSAPSTHGLLFHNASQCFIYIHPLTLPHPPFLHFFWPMTHQFVSISWLSSVLGLFILNKKCLEYFGEKRPLERLNNKNELNWLSKQYPVLAVLWLILYPTALTLRRMCRACSMGKTRPHSPKNWNLEIVSCSNNWWPDIIVQQNKGNEDVVEVAAVHWQENEGQPRVTCFLEHF